MTTTNLLLLLVLLGVLGRIYQAYRYQEDLTDLGDALGEEVGEWFAMWRDAHRD